MPSYDYKCGSCENLVTIVAGINKKIDPPVCVNCKSAMNKLFSAPPIQFKGGGFNSKKG